MIDLTQVLTFSEAAEKWGLASGNTLRKAVERKKFKPDEIRKSGDTWLTTYDAMERVFGQPRISSKTISISEIISAISSSQYHQRNSNQEFQRILNIITQAINNKETITIIEKGGHPGIKTILRTHEDLEHFLRTMERYFSSFQR